jgi:hypothetical protein
MYWRGIMHDMSKFRLFSEFIPYAKYFFGNDESHRVKQAFKIAFLTHQNRNPHHWQFWTTIDSEGKQKVMDMPEIYIKEMINDWRAAGKAKGTADGSISGARSYYLSNRDRIVINSETRRIVEQILEVQ